MPIKPRNPNNVRSSELNASHKDHTHTHASTTGQTTDDHHAEAHTVASHSDTTATGAELETLTDGSDADALHDHASAIHDDVAGEIAAITAKTTPVDADVALIEDSAATNAKKKLSWANIKATLKTYFDTLYAVAAEGVTNGDAHDHVGGDGAQIDHGGLAGLTDDDHSFYPKGEVVYVEKTTGRQTGLTSVVDLTNLTTTQTLDSTRRYRIHGRVGMLADTDGEVFSLELHQGATQIQESNGVRFGSGFSSSSTAAFLDVSIVTTGNDASTIYKLKGGLIVGSGTVETVEASIRPSFLLIEDIGPA